MWVKLGHNLNIEGDRSCHVSGTARRVCVLLVKGYLQVNYLIKIILITLLCQLGTPVSADTGNTSVLVRMFAWWNDAIKDPDGFTEEAFRLYYTEDAAIIINGNELVRGIKPMVEHFRSAQINTESVEIVLPFEQEFESAAGDRIFTYHLIRFREEDADRLSHLMGYAVVEDGKIALLDFLRYNQPVAAEAATATTGRQ